MIFGLVNWSRRVINLSEENPKSLSITSHKMPILSNLDILDIQLWVNVWFNKITDLWDAACIYCYFIIYSYNLQLQFTVTFLRSTFHLQFIFTVYITFIMSYIYNLYYNLHLWFKSTIYICAFHLQFTFMTYTYDLHL